MLKKWNDLPDFMKNEEVKPYYEILKKKKISLVLKRCMDLFGGLILLVVLAIPMAVIAVLIKVDSEGPVFYRQERITTYGKHFQIHKFLHRSFCLPHKIRPLQTCLTNLSFALLHVLQASVLRSQRS